MARWAIRILATLNIQISKGKIEVMTQEELWHPSHGFMTDQTEKQQCSNTTFTCQAHHQHSSVEKTPMISSSSEAEIKLLSNNPCNSHEETTEVGKECVF